MHSRFVSSSLSWPTFPVSSYYLSSSQEEINMETWQKRGWESQLVDVKESRQRRREVRWLTGERDMRGDCGSEAWHWFWQVHLIYSSNTHKHTTPQLFSWANVKNDTNQMWLNAVTTVVIIITSCLTVWSFQWCYSPRSQHLRRHICVQLFQPTFISSCPTSSCLW